MEVDKINCEKGFQCQPSLDDFAMKFPNKIFLLFLRQVWFQVNCLNFTFPLPPPARINYKTVRVLQLKLLALTSSLS